MSELVVEPLHGVVGYGSPGLRMKSEGRIKVAALSKADQTAVENLFAAAGSKKKHTPPGAFPYRITRPRADGAGTESVEADANSIPPALIAAVKDVLI